MAKPMVITENGKCKVEAEVKGGVYMVRPVGKLDEDMDFGMILNFLEEMKVKDVVFDMGKVSLMNSCGVREWLLFIERVQTKMNVKFFLANEVFIEQASIVPNMFGKAGTPVEKFEAPYYCGTCDKRVMAVLETAAINISGGKYSAPQFKCQTCGGELEFDALEEEYFNFLKYTKKTR